jgi:hypothetical protein
MNFFKEHVSSLNFIKLDILKKANESFPLTLLKIFLLRLVIRYVNTAIRIQITFQFSFLSNLCVAFAIMSFT